MKHDDLQNGSVILYPYLWDWQRERGETEGRKDRETVIAARFDYRGEELLALLPVTSRPPGNGVDAYEIPALEVKRLQRGGATRLWVILSEFNVDAVDNSFYLTADCKVADLSRAVYRKLHEAFAAAAPTAKRVNRKT